ncbi:hypothetical protein [Nannocystis pusilla]|uniref:hypothetical protein n=1 Tax=Nannocystis pusilla TaxID=889268 RepID=UPI003BF3B2BD
MRRLLVVCLVLTGCSAGPENFWRGLQRGLCKYYRNCGLEDGSVGECTREAYEADQTPEAFAADCVDYDPEVGRTCLRYIREAAEDCDIDQATPSECVGICGPYTSIQFYQTASSIEAGGPGAVLIAE